MLKVWVKGRKRAGMLALVCVLLLATPLVAFAGAQTGPAPDFSSVEPEPAPVATSSPVPILGEGLAVAKANAG